MEILSLELEIKVPRLEAMRAEAATVVRWLKKEGDEVKKDEPVVVLEFPKVEVEVSSPSSGVLAKVLVKEGRMVRVDDTLGLLTT
jgi:pyruvate/2-oxoglutarate dehydrogenase complex dihydrolipoamide acyltransferase (E2) component